MDKIKMYEKLNRLIESEREIIIKEYMNPFAEHHNKEYLKILQENSFNYIRGYLVCYFDNVINVDHDKDCSFDFCIVYISDKIFDYDYDMVNVNV